MRRGNERNRDAVIKVKIEKIKSPRLILVGSNIEQETNMTKDETILINWPFGGVMSLKSAKQFISELQSAVRKAEEEAGMKPEVAAARCPQCGRSEEAFTLVPTSEPRVYHVYCEDCGYLLNPGVVSPTRPTDKDTKR